MSEVAPPGHSRWLVSPTLQSHMVILVVPAEEYDPSGLVALQLDPSDESTAVVRNTKADCPSSVAEVDCIRSTQVVTVSTVPSIIHSVNGSST